MIDVIKKANADAVALASIMHYSSFNSIKKKSLRPQEGNIEFLKRNKDFKKFEKISMKYLKKNYLKKGF